MSPFKRTQQDARYLQRDINQNAKVPTRSLIAGLRELRKAGFTIQSPWNLGEKHIGYLVNLWVNEKQQSPSTVESKLTYWRTLASWMKKHQLVGTVDDYIKRPEGYRRY